MIYKLIPHHDLALPPVSGEKDDSYSFIGNRSDSCSDKAKSELRFISSAEKQTMDEIEMNWPD
ncbi:hypothetical protein DDT52_02980 [Brenneria roseae subsp. roseae]|uniref:hypothetical protein n=1 Tax=Brenneria roseae TaxID=1509241 RepID=UPI000D604927|nr:hypothetical protein [Brenneria roseae]PWC22234.1 hypothetical protein DDT52_02980 [Brenneria roseae subsp. roseae]